MPAWVWTGAVVRPRLSAITRIPMHVLELGWARRHPEPSEGLRQLRRSSESISLRLVEPAEGRTASGPSAQRRLREDGDQGAGLTRSCERPGGTCGCEEKCGCNVAAPGPTWAASQAVSAAGPEGAPARSPCGTHDRLSDPQRDQRGGSTRVWRGRGRSGRSQFVRVWEIRPSLPSPVVHIHLSARPRDGGPWDDGHAQDLLVAA